MKGCGDMNFSQDEVSHVFDTFRNENLDLSLESIMDQAGVNVGSHSDIIQLKSSSLAKLCRSDDNKEPESFVSIESGTEASVIIDERLLFSICFQDHEVINKFIAQLTGLPNSCRLNVIIELGITDVDYLVMDAGTMILNMLQTIDCIKVFNFGAQASIVDLMIAQCCEEIYVSKFASVSITKADNGARISRALIPVYRHLIKSTYNYWVKRGLFTPEEVNALFTSEAENSIQILSDTIKERIGTPVN